MNDEARTKEDLVKEVEETRRRIAELEASLAEMGQQEVAAQEAVATSKTMMEAFDGLIYVCSPTYEVEFMNEQFIRRTGYDPTGE